MNVLTSPTLSHELFARFNERLRRAGVETAERAPLMTVLLVVLHDPASRTWLEHAPSDVARLAQGLLDRMNALGVAEIAAFAAFMRPRLFHGNHPSSGAKALLAVVHEDLPALAVKQGCSVADCFAALTGDVFQLVELYEALQTHMGGNDLGQYFTPRHIVRAMTWMVEILRGSPLTGQDVVYDPAAGLGGFLVAALESAHRAGAGSLPQLIGGETTTSVAHLARMNLWMASHGQRSGWIFHASSLERDHCLDRGQVGDHTIAQPLPDAHPMMQASASPTVVLMNPPFPEDKKAYQSFEFVEHALRVLGEGGWLAALIPAVLVIGEDRLHSQFRARILVHAQLEAVVAMPPTLFAPGASINTYVVVLRKRAGGHDLQQPVFFARSQDDGYDMDRSVRRRCGPRGPGENEARQWCVSLDMGGQMARLFQTTPQSSWGTGWLFDHVATPGEKHLCNRQASSVCLQACDGSDWAPERFICDQVSDEHLIALANHLASEALCGEVRQRFRTARSGALTVEPIGQQTLDRVRKRLGKAACLTDAFVFCRASAPGAKGWSTQGTVAVISATEQDNGVCGYTEGVAGAPAPGLSVAKNGRPGVSRVQAAPYLVTGDVAALTPRSSDWSTAELCVLGAMIESQSWRFSYGRKASEARLASLRLT